MKCIMKLLLLGALLMNQGMFVLATTNQTALNEKIEYVYEMIDGVIEEDYSYASWKRLELAYEKAVALQAQPNSTQEALDQMVVELQAAIDALIKRTDLLDAKKEAKQYLKLEDKYEETSYQNFLAAYQAVIDLYESHEDYSAKDVRFACYDLVAAIEDLKVNLNYYHPKAKVIDYKTIQLTWNPHTSASRYDIYRYNNQTNQWYLYRQTTDTSITLSGLKTGTSYRFYIEMMKPSSYKDLLVYRTDEVETIPKLLGEVKLYKEETKRKRVKLNWTKVDGATRYVIYRKSNTVGWKKILTLSGTKNSYTSGEMAANTYTYQVKAARYDSVDRVMTKGSNLCTFIINN